MSYTLDIFKEGAIIACAQCKKRKTVQYDEKAPTGWWAVFDSKNQINVFCSVVCLAMFVSKVLAGSDIQLAEQTSAFGGRND